MELKLSLNTNDPVIAGSSVSIICMASIDKTLADIDIDVDIQLVSPEGMNADEQEENVLHGNYQRSITYNSISAQNSGLFICNTTVQPSTRNEFVMPAHKHQRFDLILGTMNVCNIS